MSYNARDTINELKPKKEWKRSTVADGQWMQRTTFTPLTACDDKLAEFVDKLDNALTQEIQDRTEADATEKAAREAYDLFLSQSATQIRSDLNYTSGKLSDEIRDRLAYDEFLAGSATQIRTDLTSVSSKLDTEIENRKQGDLDVRTSAFNYTDTVSSYLNGRIDTVSATFDFYSAGISEWQTNTINPALKNLSDLTSAVNALEGASDVFDVVATTADLNGYSARLTPKAIIKVLSAGENNNEQWYYRWKGNKTTASVFNFDDFSAVGHVAAYYSQAEINDMFANYYKMSETSSSQQLTTQFNNYYTTSQMDTMLGNKLDTSAQYINDSQYVTEVGKILSLKKLKVQNDWFELAARCDYNGDDIRTTYMYASAGYKKNETSGKDQLSTAFGNKLDTSASLSAYVQAGFGAPSPVSAIAFLTRDSATTAFETSQLAFFLRGVNYDQSYNIPPYGYVRKKDDITLHNNNLIVGGHWVEEPEEGCYYIQ